MIALTELKERKFGEIIIQRSTKTMLKRNGMTNKRTRFKLGLDYNRKKMIY